MRSRCALAEITLVCQVLSPSSLAVLAVLALLWIYIFVVRKEPLVLGGRTFRCVRAQGFFERMARLLRTCPSRQAVHRF